jgi:hypothetical protein
MTIPVVHEPDPDPSIALAEHCCFCDAPTHYWTELSDRAPGEQVACCRACAKTHEVSEVPTKAAWFDAENERHQSPPRTEPPSPWCFQGRLAPR